MHLNWIFKAHSNSKAQLVERRTDVAEGASSIVPIIVRERSQSKF